MPVTPRQIAESAIDAAKAGAAVVHIHVRDPLTGKGSRDTGLYAEVVERVRAADVDVVVNLTAGMGGDLVLGGDKQVQDLGVRPELEVFDTGHLVQVKEMIRDGLLDDPVMIQLCMGIAYGAPDDPTTFMAMVNNLPNDCVFSGFSISRMQLPFVAMAALAGGNVRVGLEDNLYAGPGELATNARLVEKARNILENMNVRVMSPQAVRDKLALVKR